MGEVSGDYHKDSGTTFHVYTFSGGVRFQSGSKAQRAKPFAQLLMGTGVDNGSIGHSTPTNHFPVVTPGGGVDFGVAKHFAARFKLDFPLYATFGDVHKGTRFSIGASIPVGSRTGAASNHGGSSAEGCRGVRGASPRYYTSSSTASSARSMMKRNRADGSFPISSLITRSVTI